jgi:ABC-type multidrug transport system fused ATPase/permease subunit
MKSFIKKYFHHFTFFYGHLRHRILVALSLSLMVGLMDGFGLAMFIPLLSFVSGEGSPSGESLGGMQFLVEFFQNIGIALNLKNVLFIILFFFSLKGVFTFITAYYKVIVQQYFIKKLRFQTADGLANLSYKAFIESDPGRVQNTMSAEVARVTGAYNAYLNTMQSWVLVFVYLGLAAISNPQFAILVAIGGALSNLLYRKIYDKTKQASRQISFGGHNFQGLLIQQVSFFKYLKATGFIYAFNQKLKTSISVIENGHRKIGFYNAILTAAKEPLNVGVVVLVIMIQVLFFSSNLGGIILSLLMLYRALSYVITVQSNWNQFINSSGALENLTDFLHDLRLGKEKFGKKPIKEPIQTIKLNKVLFNYGQTAILKGIDLHIPAKTTIAFVGESGSGKTTLVNLIVGLIPVDGGEILVNSQRLRDLNIFDYQSKIGYITQDPVIFNGSIFENVTLWADKTGDNMSRFEETCKKASIWHFIQEAENKENTKLGNNGIQVSGGQKQRIGIARELFKDIEILVMDEATSALDSKTEREIQENIDSLKGQYTILMIAHRLSTVRNADLIVMMENGCIEDLGAFEDLEQRNLRFRKMVELQEI